MKFFKSLLAVLALAAGLAAPAVDAATYSIHNANGTHLLVNPDGTIDSKYGAGNKPPAGPTLSCSMSGFPSLTGKTTGTPFSSSARAVFSGTGAATATLGVTKTGTNSGAWQISGDNLVHDGVLAGSGTLFITGTVSGNTVNCSTVDWSYVAPPSTDTTAPTRVTGLVQTGAATNSVTLEWDASSDPCGNVNCSGVASYNIKKNGTTVDTATGSPGLQSALTATNVGSGTGTNSCTQASGTQWTVVGAGNGLEGGSDQFQFCAAPVSGNSTQVQATVDSVTFSGAYNKVGVGLHASIADATGAAIDAYTMRTATDVCYAQVNVRTGTGQSRSNIAQTQVSCTARTYQILRPTTGTVTVNNSTDGGNTWVPLVTNYALTLPTTAYGGVLATATTVGTSTTGVLSNVNVNNVARVSKAVSTTTAGTFTLTAVDSSANESTAFAGITGTPGTPPAAGAMKFHPGIYIDYAAGADAQGNSGRRLDLSQQRTQFLAFIETLRNESTIRGIQARVDPRAIEGDTLGDFSPLQAWLPEVLAKLATMNKGLVLNVYTADFGNNAGLITIYPKYLVDPTAEGGSGGTCFAPCQYGISRFHAPQVGGGMRIWQAATADRLIAWAQYLAANFNDNKNFEMITTGETSLALDNGQDGYSCAALLTQLQRYLPAARAALTKTGIRVAANDMCADANLVSLFGTVKTIYGAVGGPDVWRGDITQADRIFVGKKSNEWPNWNGTGDRFDESMNVDVYEDLRGKIPWFTESQWQSYSGRWTIQSLYDAPMIGYTPTQPNGNGNFDMPSMHPSYMVLYANESFGGECKDASLGGCPPADTKWLTAVLPLIQSVGGEVYPRGPLASVPCPTLYPSCDRSY